MTIKPDKYSGVIRFGGDSPNGITVILDPESGWICEADPAFAESLALAVPYPNPYPRNSGYDPNPVYTATARAAELFGGEIIQEPETDRQEGVIY